MQRREFLKSSAALGASAAIAPAYAISGQTPANGKPFSAAQTTVSYPLGPDSKRRAGVPEGKVFSFPCRNSKVFSGTERMISVYVPAQYKPDSAACLWLSLDGLTKSTPTVLDNLIHDGDIPVLIAVGLQSGTAHAVQGETDPRYNRSFEFDSLTDALDKFVLDELLPELQNHRGDGEPLLNLSKDPNARGITGASTGGIGAFSLAWRNPDAFRRVYSRIGTFVGMRGGDSYPVLVRKTEPKPIRVFLQDGDQDGWPGGLEFGDWWMGNQEMERALTFAGYDVNHAWGALGHEGSHGEQILPDVLRWLWRDYPNPVVAGQSRNSFLRTILEASVTWERVIAMESSSVQQEASSENSSSIYTVRAVVDSRTRAASLACDAQGNVFVHDPSTGVIYRVGSGKNLEHFAKLNPGNNGMVFGPDGFLYVAEVSKSRVVKCNAGGEITVVADDLAANHLTMTHDGRIYAAEIAKASDANLSAGRILLLRADRTRSAVAEGVPAHAALSLSPDGQWLFAANRMGHHGYSYRVKNNGDLECGEPFYWFHMPDAADDSGCNQVCMDERGMAYAATRMGVQIFDRNGRVRSILPFGNCAVTGICFGGPDFQTLYIAAGDGVYRRKLNVVGAQPAAKAIIEPAANAG